MIQLTVAASQRLRECRSARRRGHLDACARGKRGAERDLKRLWKKGESCFQPSKSESRLIPHFFSPLRLSFSSPPSARSLDLSKQKAAAAAGAIGACAYPGERALARSSASAAAARAFVAVLSLLWRRQFRRRPINFAPSEEFAHQPLSLGAWPLLLLPAPTPRDLRKTTTETTPH